MSDPQPGSNNPRASSSSSILLSPKLFNGRGFSDSSASAMSPTSILENKPFSSIGNLLHFSDHHKQHPKKKPPFDGGAPKAVGLAIVGEEDKANPSGPHRSRMTLFGSGLKVQVPSVNPSPPPPSPPPMEFPGSPIEFGIKNRDSQLALLSPRLTVSPAAAAAASAASPRVIIGRSISASEMELSEDYTCVITHGPNPRTTHIFDDCVLESSGSDEFIVAAPAASAAEARKEKSDRVQDFDFLCYYCDACKKDLRQQGKETFMYRGEQAFCSKECCRQAMTVYGRTENRRWFPESSSPGI